MSTATATTMMKRRGFAAASAATYIFQSQKAASGTITTAVGELAFHSAADAMKYPSNVINNDINNLEDGLGLYNDMVQIRPLPSAFQFTELFGRIFKMKHYSSATSIFKDMWVLGIPVNDYNLTVVINCYCFLDRVDLRFCMLGFSSSMALTLL